MKAGTIKYVGPARVYVKNDDYPGLAMSRSIGDLVAHSVGVSSEPELYIRAFNPQEDSLLLLASDGLWEFITTEEALRIVLLYY
jgi:serine/threonine protein phosphatase PrpC